MVLYTAGYEGSTIEKFVGTMRRAGVVRVIDVRRTPLSRKKGFSKTALKEALTAEGLEYVHFRELGCPQYIRDRYKVDKDWNWYQIHFYLYLDDVAKELQELSGLIESGSSCLLCFEENPLLCHRSLIATRLRLLNEELCIRHLYPRKFEPARGQTSFDARQPSFFAF